jgi:hypothetical protein
MEVLGLDINAYAETMAEALALMHWAVQIDANDVEFVLAPPAPQSKHAPSSAFQSEYLGAHRMWILDFDCCRPMQMMKQAWNKPARHFSRMILSTQSPELARQLMRS